MPHSSRPITWAFSREYKRTDAVLDRLTHSAFSIPISGASMRQHATLTEAPS
jgi:hypothetical protein